MRQRPERTERTGRTERPDFVAGNTRLRARVPRIAAEAPRDWARLLAEVPTAYTGAARDLVALLVARYDLADTLALLRGALTGADPDRRLQGVQAIGRMTPRAAEDVAQARDAAAAVSRLAGWRLPSPEVAGELVRAWERFELHDDVEELEADLAGATHRSWRALVRPHRRRAAALWSLLGEEADRRNVVVALQVGATGTLRLLPWDRLRPADVEAARGDSWTGVLRARPAWRPVVERWPEHRSPARLEAELVDLTAATGPLLLRGGDPFGADPAVGYVLMVEAAARGARLAVLGGASWTR